MNSILITGGAGYIGSHVAWLCLERGDQVTIIDDLSSGSLDNVPSGAVFHAIDVADRLRVDLILATVRPSVVFHFAGSVSVPKSFKSPIEYYRNNVMASIGLIESCIRAGVSFFIFSSTAAVYGPSENAKVDESAYVAPSSPYGRSKIMVESVLQDVASSLSIRVGILRYFNVAGADPKKRCGPRSHANQSLISKAARVAVHDLEFLPVYGTDYNTPDGTCVRDFIHVSDLAEAHLAVLNLIAKEGINVTLNCGYGSAYSVLDVVAAFERVLGRSLPIMRMARRKGDIPALIADPTLLRSRTMWKPRFGDLDAIVASALDWERLVAESSTRIEN